MFTSAQGVPFLFKLTENAKGQLLREGTDVKYGARHLKRSIERFVVNPLANLSATRQVRLGDVVIVELDAENNKLLFYRDEAEMTKATAALDALKAGQAKSDRPRIAA